MYSQAERSSKSLPWKFSTAGWQAGCAEPLREGLLGAGRALARSCAFSSAVWSWGTAALSVASRRMQEEGKFASGWGEDGGSRAVGTGAGAHRVEVSPPEASLGKDLGAARRQVSISTWTAQGIWST